MSKILYNPLDCETKKVKYFLMKKMISSLLIKGKIEECLPALRNEEEGIFASTSNGGSKFWSYDNLLRYFKERNNETTRINV